MAEFFQLQSKRNKAKTPSLYLSEKILALPVAVYRRKYNLLWRLLEASSPSSSPTDRR